MFSKTEVKAIRSATAYDRAGTKIGRVREVYLDDETGEPTWVTVDAGLFGRTKRYAPLEDASLADDRLTLTIGRDVVMDSPDLDEGEHLAEDDEARLSDYYRQGRSAGDQGWADPGAANPPGLDRPAPASATDDPWVDSRDLSGEDASLTAIAGAQPESPMEQRQASPAAGAGQEGAPREGPARQGDPRPAGGGGFDFHAPEPPHPDQTRAVVAAEEDRSAHLRRHEPGNITVEETPVVRDADRRPQ